MESGARATPEQRRRQHVFVVNRSVEFLDVVRELLREERYNVTTTNFVPDTFHQIEAAHPCPPGRRPLPWRSGGLGFARRTAAGGGNTAPPGHPDVAPPDSCSKQAQAGHARGDEDRYLLKPFSLDALLQTIQDLIGPA